MNEKVRFEYDSERIKKLYNVWFEWLGWVYIFR